MTEDKKQIINTETDKQLSCSSHFKKKRQGMRQQKIKSQVKNPLWDNNHPLSPHPHSDMNQPPDPPPIQFPHHLQEQYNGHRILGTNETIW